MEERVNQKTLSVSGMACPGCEMRIENKLKKLPGVINVEAKYADEIVRVKYNAVQVDFLEIIETVESLDYMVQSTKQQVKRSTSEEKPKKQSDITYLLGFGVILFAGYLIIQNTIGFNFIPEINQNMGYGILFIVGIHNHLGAYRSARYESRYLRDSIFP